MLQVSHTRANQYTFKKAKRSSLVTVHVRGIDPPKLDLDGDMLDDSGLPQSKVLAVIVRLSVIGLLDHNCTCMYADPA